MNRALNRSGWLCVALTLGFALGNSLAQESPAAVASIPSDTITTAGVMLRFDQVDIGTVIDLYGRVTGRIVLPAPDVKGKVTILNRERVSLGDAARLIEAALEMQGWAAIPEGRIARIVKARDAVRRLVPTVSTETPGGLASVNRIQTHVVTLRRAKPEEVKNMISPLLSNDGNVITDARTNLLVITEVSSNMSRVLDLIGQIDRPLDQSEIIVKRVPLKHVAPKRMVEIVKDYFKDTTLRYLPDERLQTLVLSGKPEDVAEAVKVIGQIDLPVPREQVANQVVQIQFAKAAEIAALVDKLYKNRSDKPPETFSINADPPSNSIILTGPPELRDEIRSLIARIDMRYRQVVLKVLIGEVATPEGGRSRTTGIEWAHLLGNRANSEFAQDFGAIGRSAGRTNPGTGTPGLRYSLLRPADYSLFVQALETRASFKTLASPQITVSSNKEAQFRVGRKVPVQTAERISDNSNTTVRSSEYKDVVLGLKATPQITADSEIALHLELEFNEQLGRDPTLNNPIFSTREAKTDVIVGDDHTLIIGGLIRNDIQESSSEVPVLGRLPVIGGLFRRSTSDRPRQELLVMLTPTILASTAQADTVSRRYKDEWFSAPGDEKYRKDFAGIDGVLGRLTKKGGSLPHGAGLTTVTVELAPARPVPPPAGCPAPVPRGAGHSHRHSIAPALGAPPVPILSPRSSAATPASSVSQPSWLR